VSWDIVLFSGLRLVVLCWIEGQGSDELAGVAVNDPDVEVGDEGQDAGSGVGAAEADVVEAAVVTDGDDAAVVDAVVVDAVVRGGSQPAGPAAGRAANAAAGVRRPSARCGRMVLW
jgi:hypothetical protein